MTTFIDISVALDPFTVVWHDEEKPEFQKQLSISNGDGCNVTSFKMNCHTGTHMDAPFHFINDGKTVAEIDLDILIGDVLVAQVSEKKISAEVIQSLKLPACQRVLFNTGSSNLYHHKKFNPDFSALTECGASLLVDMGVKLVGIDYLSIEHDDTDLYPVHRILLANNVVILEGLNLENVSTGWYHLMALPLKLIGTEGAPARVLLFPGEAKR